MSCYSTQVEQLGPETASSGDFVEEVSQSENFPMISGRSLLESTRSCKESIGKNLDNFRPEYYFYGPAISSVFLQNTVTFPQNPLPGIFELGLNIDFSGVITRYSGALKGFTMRSR
jgi:hypothetical protein